MKGGVLAVCVLISIFACSDAMQPVNPVHLGNLQSAKGRSVNLAALAAHLGAPLDPKEEMLQKLLELLKLDASNDTVEAVQRCVMDQSGAMVAASAMQLLTFHLTEDTPYFEMIPPVAGVEVSGYQACQNIKKNVTNPPVHFCQMALPGKHTVITSTCVPQTCTTLDLDIIFYALIAPTLPPGTLGPGYPVIFACADDEKEYSDDPKAQSTAGIFTSIASVVALATLVAVTREVVQFLTAGKSDSDDTDENSKLLPSTKDLNGPAQASAPESWVWKLAACWDVRASLDALLFISPERPTNFLNGLRVFSIMWVILGHCVAYPTMPGLDNMEDVVTEVATNYRWVIVESGLYAVDTFFYMSGFLATYLLMKSFPRTITPFQAVPRVLMIYVDRYVRLTPLFGLVILASYNLLQHMCVAPFSIWYTNGGPVAAGCGENWWRDLLYINNVRGLADMTCLGHSWYLSNDMQFVLVGVPMVVFHALTADHPTLRWVSLSLPVLTLIVAIVCASTLGDSYSNPANGGDSYIYPYIRAAPYFYGVLAGIALANKSVSAQIKCVTAAWWVRYVAYSFCGAIMLGCMTLQWQAMRVTLGYHNIHWSKSMQSGCFLSPNHACPSPARFDKTLAPTPLGLRGMHVPGHTQPLRLPSPTPTPSNAHLTPSCFPLVLNHS